jgi:hypothetical protein
MSLSIYALLSADQTQVVGFNNIDPTVYPNLAASKQGAYRIVNMIAQPGFNPATQQVVQNGWTITANDVQPVWVVQALTAAQLTALTAQTNYQAALALNIVAASTNAINNWATLSAAAKDTILLDLVKVVRGLLQVQFGVNN